MMLLEEGTTGYLTVSEDGRYPQEVHVWGPAGTLVYAPVGELDEIPRFVARDGEEARRGEWK